MAQPAKFSEHGLISRYTFKEKKPVLIDVGAHHGGFSKIFAQKGWRVVAFEPERNNLIKFKKNLAAFENVDCIEKAVSNLDQKSRPFYTSDIHHGIHSLKPFHETHHLSGHVETVRLDVTLARMDIPLVSLLKIDIEGADLLALKSFDFQKYQPEIIIAEFMDNRSIPNFDYTHHDMAAFMQDIGYFTFISEWEPIKSYYREGAENTPHKWIQCVPYPLEHEPSWGNVIFVPEKDKNKFIKTLDDYLMEISTPIYQDK
jgi:FkbM family methyltransferase